jgi:membrane dipeptidase
MMVIEEIGGRARALLRSAIVWDNHGCLPLRADETFLPQLARYRDSGVNVVSINIGFADMSWAEHLTMLSFLRRWISLHPESYRLVSTVDDIQRCKREQRLGIVFDIEGMCPVEENLHLVQTFYELGVRWMLIAYNRNNAAGGGCLDADAGLTSIGRSVIDEMERVGMVLCLSHTGARTAAEALEYARNPAIFSHSNPYGDTPHSRNIADPLMQACARKGGVIGLSGLGPLLGGDSRLVDRLLRQLHYGIDRVGADHIGLGLDFVFDMAELDELVRSNPTLFPLGMDMSGGIPMIAPEAMGVVAERLAQDNLTDSQISGILGGNWFRVAAQVWR